VDTVVSFLVISIFVVAGSIGGENVRVARIRIHNVLGIEALEFKLGQGLTVIEGANSTGKTSVLSAISAALGGGHDASLIRRGASEAEAVLVLDDGTEVKKRITPRKSSVDVDTPDGLGAGQKYLNRLIKGEALDLVAFIDAEPKRRVEMLRAALPQPSPELVAEAKALCDRVGTALGSGPRTLDPEKDSILGFLEATIAEVYDRRTFVGRQAREARAAHAETRRALPSDHAMRRSVEAVDADLARGRAELDGKLKALRQEELTQRSECAAALARIGQEQQNRSRAESASLAKRQDAIGEKYAEQLDSVDAEIAELRAKLAEAQGRRAAIEKGRQAEVANVQAGIKAAIEKIDAECAQLQANAEREAAAKWAEAAARQQSVASVGEAEQRARLAERDAAIALRALLGQVEQNDAVARKFEAGYEALTGVVDALRALESRVLGSIPVDGLAVKDGEVYLRDVPFPRLSGAEQVQLAVEVARLGIGPLPLILCDRLESLDAERLEALRKRVSEVGLQLVATRVAAGGGPLRVTS